MPAYKFPNVSFDWLAELPGLSQEYGASQERRAALENLDSSDPKALRAAGNKLLRTSDLKSMEMGLRLHTAAQAQESLAQRGASDALYWSRLPEALRANQEFGRIGAGTQPQGSWSPLGEGTSAPGPAWPSPGRDVLPPGTVGPQSELAPPSLSDSVISRAQRAMAGEPEPQAPRVALAQAGGVPSGAPPPTQQPSWAADILRAPPGAVLRGTPPGVPPQRASDDRAVAREEAQFAAQQLIKLGPKPSPGEEATWRARLNNALGRMNMPDEERHFQIEQVDRQRRGEAPITMSEYRRLEKVGPDIHKEMSKYYGTIQEGEAKAKSLRNTLGQMSGILADPRFRAGETAFIQKRGMSALRSIGDLLKSMGVPESIVNQHTINEYTEPLPLMEAYNALSNLAVTQFLGGLGNQISRSDQQFISDAFPGLGLSVEGNKLLVELMGETNNYAIRAGEAARRYRRETGEHRATVVGMEDAINDYQSKHSLFTNPDGTPTKRGEEVLAKIQRIREEEARRLGPRTEPTPPPVAAPSRLSPNPVIVPPSGSAPSVPMQPRPPLPMGPPPYLRDRMGGNF